MRSMKQPFCTPFATSALPPFSPPPTSTPATPLRNLLPIACQKPYSFGTNAEFVVICIPLARAVDGLHDGLVASSSSLPPRRSLSLMNPSGSFTAKSISASPGSACSQVLPEPSHFGTSVFHGTQHFFSPHSQIYSEAEYAAAFAFFSKCARREPFTGPM